MSKSNQPKKFRAGMEDEFEEKSKKGQKPQNNSSKKPKKPWADKQKEFVQEDE